MLGPGTAQGRAAGIGKRRSGSVAVKKKVEGKAEAMAGKAEKGVGKATHNRSVEAKGKARQVAGNLKQSGEKVKDAFKK